jgi:hypothetical protein
LAPASEAPERADDVDDGEHEEEGTNRSPDLIVGEA